MALFTGSGYVSAGEIHGCSFGADVIAEAWADEGAMTDVHADGPVWLSGNRMSAARIRAGSLAVWGNDTRLVDVWVSGPADLSRSRTRVTNLHVAGNVDASGPELHWAGGTIGAPGDPVLLESWGADLQVVNVELWGEAQLLGGDAQWTGGRIHGDISLEGSGEMISGVAIDGNLIGGSAATIRGCVIGRAFTLRGSILLNAVGGSEGCHVTDNLIYAPDDAPGIVVDGDGNVIVGNRIVGDDTPHAIEIESGTGNVMVGNVASGSFTGAEYVDSGTSTQTVWPGATAPQGDNLII